jgi:MtN3 and saliva related transmembrane protein
MNVSLDLLGYAAGILTTGSFVPQAVRAYRAGNRDAISLVGVLALTIGNGCWLVYGIGINNWPMVAANSVAVCLCAAICIRKALDVMPSAR